MEGTFLGIIFYLDQAESLANDAVPIGDVTPELALLIGEAKQQFIERFADMNMEQTLQPMRDLIGKTEE